MFIHEQALKWPTQFIKGRSSLANPDEPVLVPKCAQDESMDLEAEVKPHTARLFHWAAQLIPGHRNVQLAFIIGKTGKNIPREKALEHVVRAF